MQLEEILKGLPIDSKIEFVPRSNGLFIARNTTYKKIGENIIVEVKPWDYIVGEDLTISQFCEMAEAELNNKFLMAVQLPRGRCYPIESERLQEAIRKIENTQKKE